MSDIPDPDREVSRDTPATTETAGVGLTAGPGTSPRAADGEGEALSAARADQRKAWKKAVSANNAEVRRRVLRPRRSRSGNTRYVPGGNRRQPFSTGDNVARLSRDGVVRHPDTTDTTT